MIMKIDARVSFIATLEDSVMCCGLWLIALSHGAIFVHSSEDRSRACVNNSLDLSGRATRSLEDVYCADDVDKRAETRVCLAGRHLQARQMDDVSDGVLYDDWRQAFRFRNVTCDKMRA